MGNKKAPVIRFKGYTEDWEQRKLKDLADKVSVGIATSSSQYFSNREQGIPFIKNQNIKGNWIDDKNLEYISKEFDKANSTKRIKEGDILTVRTGYPGLSAVVPKELDGAQTFTTLITRLKKGIAIPEFVSIFINSDAGMKQILGMEAGGAQKNVNAGILQNLSIPLPSLVEQKKISKFVIELDKTIALHLCKQRQLGLLKQRLIKEILPQSDSTLPHLRFANFRKPWEQHQLKEVLKVNSGRDYKHLNEGNIPVYGTGGYMLSVDGKLSDVDGIGLGRKGTIDKPQYLKAPFWTVDTLFYLTPSPNYDIYFLYTLIQNVNWKSMDESTGVPSLSKSVIERVTLTFPILEEQQKIGSFFREFDNTISLHQQKIAHLKALKSTILNKMFI